MIKRENIICIFAHPDDEAFGPAGIIANWALTNDVYLICVTDGSNPNSGIKELKNIRREELLKSAKILGIKKVYFLGYCDGELRNNIYHEVAGKIEKILRELKPAKLLTFELHGVSGHIDHIFTSMVVTYLYKRLAFIKKIYYYAEFKIVSKLMKNYFIYFPEGFKREEVDHVENISSAWKQKVKAIKAHISQKQDGVKTVITKKILPKEEYFFIKSKSFLN